MVESSSPPVQQTLVSRPEEAAGPGLPCELCDKRGRPFRIDRCGSDEAACAALSEMYRRFRPKECSQGLPPAAQGRCEEWVRGLLSETCNLVAVAEGRVVGHAALLEIESGRVGEFLIFVHQDDQNRGIGTALTRAAIELAKAFGYSRLWLTVEALNPRAIHVYERSGFRLVGPRETEREMVADLGPATPATS